MHPDWYQARGSAGTQGPDVAPLAHTRARHRERNREVGQQVVPRTKQKGVPRGPPFVFSNYLQLNTHNYLVVPQSVYLVMLTNLFMRLRFNLSYTFASNTKDLTYFF